MPKSLSLPINPTREFWIHVLESKIEATIRNEGDMIGWEDDEEMVGPIALAANSLFCAQSPTSYHQKPLGHLSIVSFSNMVILVFIIRPL